MEALKNKKPLLLTLAGLAGIIAATAAVALILRGRGGTRFSGSENAPYPYSWVERNNGAIALTVETGGVKNGAWTLADAVGGTAEINVGKTSGGKTSVTMTPKAGGRELVTLALTNGEDRLAELSLTVLTERESEESDRLAATITEHSERVFQGAVRGGEDTGHPFTVRGGDGGLTIFVEESEAYTDDGTAWESESTNTMAAFVSTVDVADGGVTFRLESRSDGSAEVRVFSAREQIAFVFDVEVTGGDMLLIDSRTEPYEAYEPEEAEDTEAEDMETEDTEAGKE